MHPVLGCCGYRCDLCPAYGANLRGPADQQRASDGWSRYYGLQFPAERIGCDGCRDMRTEARRIDTGCPVRSCALARGLETCATCPKFGCKALRSRRVVRGAVERRVAGKIPAEDVQSFVLPYLGWSRLERLRAERPARDPECRTPRSEPRA